MGDQCGGGELTHRNYPPAYESRGLVNFFKRVLSRLLDVYKRGHENLVLLGRCCVCGGSCVGAKRLGARGKVGAQVGVASSAQTNGLDLVVLGGEGVL